MSVVEAAVVDTRAGAQAEVVRSFDDARGLRDATRAACDVVCAAGARLLADVYEARMLPLASDAASALMCIDEALQRLVGAQITGDDASPSAAPASAGSFRALAGRFVVDSRALLNALQEDGSRAEDAVRFERLCVQEVALVADALARRAEALDAPLL